MVEETHYQGTIALTRVKNQCYCGAAMFSACDSSSEDHELFVNVREAAGNTLMDATGARVDSRFS
jgi:hypothetical protein